MKGNTMPYEEFQAYMANYGFIVCPMTREEYGEAFALGARHADMYGIACDMNCRDIYSELPMVRWDGGEDA